MLLKYLTHPSLVFFVLPWIMALLVAGTVVQPAMGIYQAQKFFFEGFVFWLGPVPLPGMFSLLVLLATSLSAKILFTSTFSWPHSGTWLIHAGALLLLVGGLVTSLTQQEGSMLLAPEETKNIFDDYYDKELVINKNGDDVVRIAFARAAAMKGDDFRALVPFDMSVTKACHNCDVVQDQNNTVRLVARPHEKDAEKNLAGVQLRVQGRDMLVVQGMPAHVSAYQHGDDIYHVSIHRKKHALPFSIRLLSFSPSFHPGTHVAREYASVIEVADGAL
ncbi:MAG: hypothetical protein EBZ69_07935, partial [Alphaproteobacteria bacterium]|nr:hypothetical protein [Alphaproteobacteria bacterium]